MTEPARDPRPVRLAVPAALFLVVAAAVYLFASRLPHREPPPPAPGDVPATGEIEDPVGRALRLAGIDSTRKNEWVDELPGLDASALGPERRAVFVRLANSERCTCGCGFTLAACRAFDSTCDKSAPRAQALYDSVAAGHYDGATGLREPPARP